MDDDEKKDEEEHDSEKKKGVFLPLELLPDRAKMDAFVFQKRIKIGE